MLNRRHLMASALASATLPGLALAQSIEKPKLTIAVGGKNLFYYLPLTIAEQLGYFKDEGLDVTVVDFAGGSKALQAVVGGSADVVSGAFEHTVNMQFKGQPMRAFVLQGLAPQVVLGINPRTTPSSRCCSARAISRSCPIHASCLKPKKFLAVPCPQPACMLPSPSCNPTPPPCRR